MAGAIPALILAACPDGRTVRRCASDADCKDANIYRCDKATGYCLCRTNGACRSGETCNAAGYCVPQSRCTSSRECSEGQICETTTGTCVASGRCASDLACPTGNICDRATSSCKAGCRSNGDCRAGEVCVCQTALGEEVCQCPVTGELARQTCPQVSLPDGGTGTGAPGKCMGDRCGDSSFCAFGEVCATPEPGLLPQCISDYDPRFRPYCDNCVFSPGGVVCGQGANYCLTAFDPRTGLRYDFCGVDCSSGQPCPNGYLCDDVIVVYGKWQCGSDADCTAPEKRSSLICSKDEDCPRGGRCFKELGALTGWCYARCYRQEGAGSGFCGCIVDEDCFQDSCDPVSRTCTVSRKPCDLSGAGCTTKIRCVDFGGAGGCLIGKNCAPVEGLTCADVRP